jgi:hypothetical protein
LPSLPGEKKKSISELVKENGVRFLVCYSAVSSCAVASLYMGISYAGQEATVNALESVGVGRIIDLKQLNPSAGNLAAAMLVNQLLEPVRWPIVLYLLKITSTSKAAEVKTEGVFVEGNEALNGKDK